MRADYVTISDRIEPQETNPKIHEDEGGKPAQHEDLRIPQTVADCNLYLEPRVPITSASVGTRNDSASPTQPDAGPCFGAISSGPSVDHRQFQRGSEQLFRRSVARRHRSHAH